MKLSEVAESLGLEFRGQPEKKISQIKDIERLVSPESIVGDSIYYIEGRSIFNRYSFLQEKEESITVLTSESLATYFSNTIIAPEKRIKLSFIKLLDLFSQEPNFKREKAHHHESFIHETAKVSPSAIIMPQAIVMQHAEVADGVIVYPHVTIGPSAKIRKNTVLHPSVVIGYNCIIGSHCIIYGGSVIGADGFGYHSYEGEIHKVPQISHVEIHDHVEIGANSCIDRGTIEPTIIGSHTKIDNQVQISHNCVLDKAVILAAQVGIAGSVTIGEGTLLAGKAGVSDHINVAKGGALMASSVLLYDTKPQTTYFGYPARDSVETHRINNAVSRLPDLLKRVKKLEKEIYDENHGD